MEITHNQQAIELAALFFVRGGFSLESGLHDGEISALHVLKVSVRPSHLAPTPQI